MMCPIVRQFLGRWWRRVSNKYPVSLTILECIPTIQMCTHLRVFFWGGGAPWSLGGPLESFGDPKRLCTPYPNWNPQLLIIRLPEALLCQWKDFLCRLQGLTVPSCACRNYSCVCQNAGKRARGPPVSAKRPPIPARRSAVPSRGHLRWPGGLLYWPEGSLY